MRTNSMTYTKRWMNFFVNRIKCEPDIKKCIFRMDHLHMQKCYCNKRRIPRFSPPSSVAYYISVQGVNLGQCISKFLTWKKMRFETTKLKLELTSPPLMIFCKVWVMQCTSMVSHSCFRRKLKSEKILVMQYFSNKRRISWSWSPCQKGKPS